jgi:hypothetical protein
MMKAASVALALIGLSTTLGQLQGTAAADDGKLNVMTRWEYRVVTKDELIDLGKKDLTTGLNKLGDEGWELVAVDGSYVFKRPKDQIRRQAVEIQHRISLIESDVELLKERVAWAERMGRKGYMTERQVNAERIQLKEAENALEEAREQLKALPAEQKKPAEMLPAPAPKKGS